MYKQIGRIRVHAALLNAVEADILPGTGLSAAAFWKSLDDVLHEFGGRNAALLRPVSMRTSWRTKDSDGMPESTLRS